MKSVLISIQPKWCELIASGKKTVEVRKTRPKLETPFKCYIYKTKKRILCDITRKGEEDWYGCVADKTRIASFPNLDGGKIIGEFVCNKVEKFTVGSLRCDDIEKLACLSYSEMLNYFYKLGELNGKTVKFGYAWHISDLKIYDKPKELGEFRTICKDICRQKYDGQVDYFCKDGYGSCAVKDEREQEECIYFDCSPVGGESCEYEDYAYCLCNGLKPLTRPFQSWGYVEE